MKTKLIIIVVAGVVIFSIARLSSPGQNGRKADSQYTLSREATPTPENPAPAIDESQSLFVPYWALQGSEYASLPYRRLYYFGVTATKDGIDTEDAGYKGLERFECPKKQKCILVVRMLDPDLNQEALNNPSIRKKIIGQSLEIARENGYAGIALDLEMTTINALTVSGRINDFVEEYYTAAKTAYKSFSFIMYGDVFYRKRPYDVSFISGHSDEIMVMAYDMNKSYGEPGPNFSYEDKQTYGYDFKEMVRNFKEKVPPSKLTVIFGMYGYDWTMNEQGTPLKKASALSLRQIHALLSDTPGAQVVSDPVSKEKMIEYTDGEGSRHIVWFEDEESSFVKAAHLRKEGIGSVSFWVWGYF